MTIYNTLSSAVWSTRWSKLLKKPTLPPLLRYARATKRSFFQSIDHLLNRIAVPRFPLSSSDLELAESFKNFTSQIKLSPSVRVWQLRQRLPVKRFVVTIIHEFTNFRAVSSKKISDLIGFKVESCDVYPVLRLYWNLVCLCYYQLSLKLEIVLWPQASYLSVSKLHTNSTVVEEE